MLIILARFCRRGCDACLNLPGLLEAELLLGPAPLQLSAIRPSKAYRLIPPSQAPLPSGPLLLPGVWRTSFHGAHAPLLAWCCAHPGAVPQAQPQQYNSGAQHMAKLPWAASADQPGPTFRKEGVYQGMSGKGITRIDTELASAAGRAVVQAVHYQ